MPIRCRAERLQKEVGHANVLTDRAQPRTHECAGPAVYKVTPALVALLETTEQVRACVRACVHTVEVFDASIRGDSLFHSPH